MGQNINLATGVQGGATASLTVEASAEGMRQVLAELTPEQAGGFYCWDGRAHPW
jgi:hypothetical protein